MNPKGAALSDVWRDLPRRPIRDGVTPADVLNRIALLTNAEAEDSLHVVQISRGVETGQTEQVGFVRFGGTRERRSMAGLGVRCKPTTCIRDCVSFLKKSSSLHPHGAFDLTFADPPTIWRKPTANYGDALAEKGITSNGATRGSRHGPRAQARRESVGAEFAQVGDPPRGISSAASEIFATGLLGTRFRIRVES